MADEGDRTKLANPNILNSLLDSLGWGKFQWVVLLLVGLAIMSDGAELTVLSVLTTTLQAEWSLNAFKMAVLTGVVFFGQILGSVIVGIWGDDVGRVTILKAASLILLTFGLLSAAMPEFWSFVVIRGVTGVGSGFIGGVPTAYSSETTPLKQRGLSLVVSGAFFNIGQIYVALVSLVLLPDMDPTYWRLLIVLTAVPVMCLFPLVICYAVESPYFLATHERYDEAIDSLNAIARTNSQPALSEKDKELLLAVPFKSEGVGLSKIKLLFDEEKKCSTMLLTLLWFLAVFTYFGMLFIVPKTIGAGGGNFMVLCILTIGVVQIPSQVIVKFTVEIACIGRKHTMTLGTLGQSVSAFAAVCLTESSLFLLPVACFFLSSSVCFTALYVYTAELYETRVRTMALCFFNAFGRLGGVIGPGLLFNLSDQRGESAPYVSIMAACLIALCICLLLPFETRNKGLDTNNR
jgi:MFS family permease